MPRINVPDQPRPVKPPERGNGSERTTGSDRGAVVPIDRGRRKREQLSDRERLSSDHELLSESRRQSVAIDLDPSTFESYFERDLWSLLSDPQVKRSYEAGRDDSRSFKPDSWPLGCRQSLDYLTTKAKASIAQVLGIAIDRGVYLIINRLRHPEDRPSNKRNRGASYTPLSSDYLQEAGDLRDLISTRAKDLPQPEADLLTCLKDFKIPFTLPSSAGHKGGINVRVSSSVLDKSYGIATRIGLYGWDFTVLAFMQSVVDLSDGDGGDGYACNNGHREDMARCLDGFLLGVEAKARALRAVTIEFGLAGKGRK